MVRSTWVISVNGVGASLKPRNIVRCNTRKKHTHAQNKQTTQCKTMQGQTKQEGAQQAVPLFHSKCSDFSSDLVRCLNNTDQWKRIIIIDSLSFALIYKDDPNFAIIVTADVFTIVSARPSAETVLLTRIYWLSGPRTCRVNFEYI